MTYHINIFRDHNDGIIVEVWQVSETVAIMVARESYSWKEVIGSPQAYP